MVDPIEKALDEWTDTTRRCAAGEVNGKKILLIKCVDEGVGPKTGCWTLEVYIERDKAVGFEPNKRENNLSAQEAQALFDELCEEYELKEL